MYSARSISSRAARTLLRLRLAKRIFPHSHSPYSAVIAVTLLPGTAAWAQQQSATIRGTVLVEGLGLPFPLVFALLSTAADSICACLAGIGFLTRWASAVIAINMTVAVYFEATGGDPLELPALYLLCALVLVITGAGAYSLDGRRSRGSVR